MPRCLAIAADIGVISSSPTPYSDSAVTKQFKFYNSNTISLLCLDMYVNFSTQLGHKLEIHIVTATLLGEIRNNMANRLIRVY